VGLKTKINCAGEDQQQISNQFVFAAIFSTVLSSLHAAGFFERLTADNATEDENIR
jgi:hypothetical protein